VINDQAILHLIGRQEHEIVLLQEKLRQAHERIRELEAAATENHEPPGGAAQ
jgi:hypothetical protein